VHVVGASITHGRLAKGSHPLLVWFATLLDDERRASMHLRGPARRILYSGTLKPLSYLERRVLQAADRVMVMSPHTAQLVIDQSLAGSNTVQVVPVPVDTDCFRPPETGTVRQRVLFIGRVRDPRKGFDRLLSVVERSAVVRAKGVRVVSPGPAPALRSCIEWLGRVENLADCYRSAAILALPSRQEGLGIVAFEALASGTPVVAYRCGGPDEFLERSGGAILVNNGQEFAHALETLLGDPVARTALGNAGRSWIVKNMSSREFLAKRELFSL
jgi:glycosyltransferase involved in cell wall biosynthesis